MILFSQKFDTYKDSGLCFALVRSSLNFPDPIVDKIFRTFTSSLNKFKIDPDATRIQSSESYTAEQSAIRSVPELLRNKVDFFSIVYNKETKTLSASIPSWIYIYTETASGEIIQYKPINRGQFQAKMIEEETHLRVYFFNPLFQQLNTDVAQFKKSVWSLKELSTDPIWCSWHRLSLL